MHVCHITSVHPRYDIRIFIKECVSLQQHGYMVSLIVADGKDDENKHDINIYNVRTKSVGRIKRILQIPWKIYTKILMLKPDIVHLHDPELLIIVKFLIKKGIKVIYDVHENLPKQILTKYWIAAPFRKFLSKLIGKIELYLAKDLTAIVTVVPEIVDRFNNKNIIILYNYPILSDNLQQQTINVNSEHHKIDLVYIGSISKSRGIYELIKSLSLSNLKLNLAGRFSETTLYPVIQKLDGFKNVIYHGVLSHNDANQLLHNSRVGIVTLLPTPNHLDSLPIKLFEYMMAGIPVIASDFPKWRDIVVTHNCGLVVNPFNITQIAEACLYLINNPDIAYTMGENGRKAINKLFNWNNEVEKLCELYNNI